MSTRGGKREVLYVVGLFSVSPLLPRRTVCRSEDAGAFGRSDNFGISISGRQILQIQSFSSGKTCARDLFPSRSRYLHTFSSFDKLRNTCIRVLTCAGDGRRKKEVDPKSKEVTGRRNLAEDSKVAKSFELPTFPSSINCEKSLSSPPQREEEAADLQHLSPEFGSQ